MKSKKLWQAKPSDNLHPLIEKYTVGDDQRLDQQLLGYDIVATAAHAHMLEKIGILSADEYTQLAKELDHILAEWKNDTFILTDNHEDCHTAIELHLTSKLGPIGKKVHTGRSRNDQALVMMRLYLKDHLEKTVECVHGIINAYEKKISEFGTQVMPGYTHTQKAMPTTVAMWLGSYRDAFEDLAAHMTSVMKVIDQNPLGSAAGFGVSLPLDRAMTTHELGFGKTQENPMYCGISRGVFELIAVQALSCLMVFAGKFAEDMIRFTSQEYNFFALPNTMTTGSSIMPHKRNYDVFEIMRANAREFPSYNNALQSVVTGVGSGYHRDLQLTKGTTMRAFSVAIETLDVLALCVSHIAANKPALNAAMTDELQTVAAINKLVEQGMPFRGAYLQVKHSLED